MSSLSLDCALLGLQSVGKTAIIHRLLGRAFQKTHLPTIEDKYCKVAHSHNEPIKINLLDTSGDPIYRSIHPKWLRFKDAVLLVFDVNCYSSYLELFDLLKHYEASGPDSPLVFVVANKVEHISQRQVTPQQGQELAQRFKGEYFEVSARDDTNIQQLFDRVISCFCEGQLRLSHNNSFKTNISEFSHGSKQKQGQLGG